MTDLLKKLKQLWSFKILSALGIIYLLVLTGFIISTIAQFMCEKCSSVNLGFLFSLFLVVAPYTFIFIILLFSGIIEYFKKKEFIECEKDKWFYIFSTGLVITPLIHAVFLILICISPWVVGYAV